MNKNRYKRRFGFNSAVTWLWSLFIVVLFFFIISLLDAIDKVFMPM